MERVDGLSLAGDHVRLEPLSLAHVPALNERIVGSTRFYELERRRSPAENSHPDACLIGYSWLAASAQRTACNTEAKLLMLSHAFEIWQVHRVAFRIDARNDRSRSAVERLGAEFEGVRRAERIGADGSVQDSAFYSVLPAEWPAVKKRLISRLTLAGSR